MILGLGAGRPWPAPCSSSSPSTSRAEPAHPAAAVPGLGLQRHRSGRAWSIGVALFGAASYLPTFLQMVDGATATESGLLMLPMMAGIVGASIVSGQLISHTGRYKVCPVLGGALAAARHVAAVPPRSGHAPAALQRLDGRPRRSASAW